MKMHTMGAAAVGLALMATAAHSNQPPCDALWSNATQQKLDDFHAGMHYAEATRREGTAYQLARLVDFAFMHVQEACTDRFDQLPDDLQTKPGYTDHFLRINGLGVTANQLTERTLLTVESFRERARSRTGFKLGLPGGSALTRQAAPTGQAPARATPQGRKPESVIPGCPSCTTRQSH